MMKIMTSTVELPPSIRMAGAAAVDAGKPEQGLVSALTRLYGCSVFDTQHPTLRSCARHSTGLRPTAALLFQGRQPPHSDSGDFESSENSCLAQHSHLIG